MDGVISTESNLDLRKAQLMEQMILRGLYSAHPKASKKAPSSAHPMAGKMVSCLVHPKAQRI